MPTQSWPKAWLRCSHTYPLITRPKPNRTTLHPHSQHFRPLGSLRHSTPPKLSWTCLWQLELSLQHKQRLDTAEVLKRIPCTHQHGAEESTGSGTMLCVLHLLRSNTSPRNLRNRLTDTIQHQLTDEICWALRMNVG